jgi:UDP-N-acetylglucosamine 1-carboxyvinyltransferase
MMAATLADGETLIENAAREPEVVDLANFCNSMGAKIQGAGTSTITIVGVDKLHSTEYTVIPDRIEAGTFLTAGAITRSDLLLSPVVPEHLLPVIAKLREMGVPIIEEGTDGLRIKPAEALRAADIETLPHPGFPTDMQAPFMSLLAVADGDSLINETVFENRLRHASELNRLGADIRVKGNIAFIRGVPVLSGAPVIGSDLRAAAALVVAGLAASGKTTIKGLQFLDRGYDRLDLKLLSVGAKIKRVSEAEADVTENTNLELGVKS